MNPIKILVVDDLEVNRLLLGKMLGDVGEVYFAENGADGVQTVEESLLREDPYHLICLDITMPVMDGLEALHTIRDAEARHGADRATIFMITASSSPEHMLQALENAGCDDFIVKPVMKKMLLPLLEKHGVIN
jgi:two-component system chemotaxis response regulator CheY